tara:strand:+ start:2099 stop:2491 length:393 start_codon:yes stop_codon:yes gene_type:complete
MTSRRPRKIMVDFCYRYIRDNGKQSATDLLQAYDKQDLSLKRIGLCSHRELASLLSKDRLFFKVKEDWKIVNGNKVYKYDINDVHEVAKKLALLTHIRATPAQMPKILRDAYLDACEAKSTDLNRMSERV